MVSVKIENILETHPLKHLRDQKKYIEGAIPSFTLIYATQSNTSKRFAERIAKDASYLNIKTQIKNISEVSVEDDFNKNIFMVFFVSTYGEGGPSDDAMEFNREIEKKTLFDNLTNNKMNYAIFGLGSTKYEYYNQMAKKIDKFFLRKNLNKICDVGLGDDSKDINRDFEEWRKLFWEKSYDNFSSRKDEIISLSEKLNLNSIFAKNEKEFIVISNSKRNENDINATKNYSFEITNEDYDYGLKRYKEASYCKIKEIIELRKETINGSTLLVKYDCENINYQVGDNIGIYPVNNEIFVNEILSKLSFDKDEKFEVKKNKLEVLKKKINFPSNMTIKEILMNYIDLSAHIE